MKNKTRRKLNIAAASALFIYTLYGAYRVFNSPFISIENGQQVYIYYSPISYLLQIGILILIWIVFNLIAWIRQK